MYGIVNKAIEELLTREFGTDTWWRIAARAGVADVVFVSMDPYPDEVTYALVEAAAAETGRSVDDLLRAMGEFWILYTGREGYGELLDVFGPSFGEFLQNLETLHARVGLTFPGLRPPSFDVVDLGDGRYRLTYRSERDGLVPMVEGLLEGLARRYGMSITMDRRAGADGRSHDFEIQVSPVTVP